MTDTIRGISSMATRALLAELLTAFTEKSGVVVTMESVGGVDAARRVQAGEAFDWVVLASDAIDRLIAGGHLRAGSRVDLVRSDVAVAVRAGASLPDISTEASLRAAVLAAASICYSNGPSGIALMWLFDRWGIADALQGRLVQAQPGVPVASMVARGEVALGFQQLSEMLGQPGIEVIGPLPQPVQIVTTFSAGAPLQVAAGSELAERLKALQAFITAPPAALIISRHGMAPA